MITEMAFMVLMNTLGGLMVLCFVCSVAQVWDFVQYVRLGKKEQDSE